MVEARGRAAMATGALALVVAGALTAAGTRPVAPPPSLLLDGVVVLARDGEPVVAAVPPWSGAAYAESSRVPAADRRLAARGLAVAQRAWLESGALPGRGGPWEEMVSGALLDLHVLDGATFTQKLETPAGEFALEFSKPGAAPFTARWTLDSAPAWA